ncbi:MAG: hypothetical protein JWO14_148 [Solirubrobacterales bacterium]|nr:hypothetical protein [Solirubrobacterales bacterium]
MSGRKVVDCGLSKAQRRVVLKWATIWLIDKTTDLELTSRRKDPARSIEEVAALGRLVRGLEDGEVEVPDKVLGELVARRTDETERLDELRRAKEEYEKEKEEHKAWVKLLGVIVGHQGASGE